MFWRTLLMAIATGSCTLGVFLPHADAADAAFKAGVAVVEITPPRGWRMSGYFRERINTGVKDPLLAKAVVFRQGETAAALVFCDLIGIAPDVSAAAREKIAKRTGIPQENIAIAATHSHTGPLYFGYLRELWHRRAVETEGRDPHEPIDYKARLVDRIVEAVADADRHAAPVRLAAGYAHEDRLSFNRRFHMKNGTVRFNPGALNPNIVRPAGPIDPQVGLIRLSRRDDDQPFAAIVNFALHLDTVGGTEYSADFPKHLQDHLQRRFGSSFVSLFGTGTCGDINHVDVKVRTRRSAEEIGRMLAETVAQRLPDLPAVEKPSLAVAREIVPFPLQRYSEERIQKAREMIERVDDRRIPFLDRVEAYKILALTLREGDTLPMEVQVFRLAPEVAVVTLPGEVFVDLGLAIKRQSPFETTLVIELTNDAPGYIPTKKAFLEGSYETVNSRVQPGGGEALVEAAVRLLQRLDTQSAE